MKIHWIIRIVTGLIVASYVYNRALSLPPGTDLALSTSERLYAPHNVRLVELTNDSDESPRFMLYVDDSVPWMIASTGIGLAWVGLLSFLPYFTRPNPADNGSDFLEEECSADETRPFNTSTMEPKEKA
ncbi:hypothetical protein [Luteolibacter sp. AS25]|uniref:hypothetical protein n=1 Tax=Luteolibacter sp. AS25 TaxID=3135776 RepID=UPI00398A5521